ncbi:PucR family transcriptional regulator [Streptomyces sp. NPDC001675]
MNAKPSASLSRVLHDLGTTLLELVHGDPRRHAAVGGVVIHDPLEELALPDHALVLGVGLRQPAEIAAFLRELGRHRAAGLVLRAPVPDSPLVATAARESSVAVLALTPGASWTQLTTLLRSILAEDVVGATAPETVGGIPSGDLFAVANAIAALLDAPVTIEDRSLRVLAFSGRQDEADGPRIQTVLGRQVPELYSRLLAEGGLLRELYRGDRPLYIESLPTESDEPFLPRVAIAVRAGDEVLGSIWAAVRAPLSEERSYALCDAAKVLALHLLRVRAGADVERRLRTDLLSTALEGGSGAREALTRLGLAGQSVAVLALGTRGPNGAGPASTDATAETRWQWLGDALALHLSAVHPRSATAVIGDVVYGLLPVPDEEKGEERAVRIAGDFLERIGGRAGAVVGVGEVACTSAELAGARSTADRVLGVLRAGAAGDRRVARPADVHVESLLLQLRDLAAARGDRPVGPVARLAAYDARHDAVLVETLRAWLDAFGDVIAASRAMYVHPNTFRYRLRRVAEVGEVDLGDPQARFAAMLQLRITPTE